MKATERERERQRYLKTRARTYGRENAIELWNAYEQLILAKYGNGSDDLEAAWKTRDLAHSRIH
jgi:hypothetical protein